MIAAFGMWESLGGFGIMLLIVAPFLYLAFRQWMREGPDACLGCGHASAQHIEGKWGCMVVACDCRRFKKIEG